MSWPRTIAARFRSLLGRARQERELDEELRFHLEMQIEDNLRAGMDPQEARYAALRSFGAIEPMKETYRERRTFAWVEATAQDLRYAVRALRKSPGFTLTAVTVLALAIGANTAMFSVLNAVLLRPLPYPSPNELVMLWSEIPGQGARERSAYWNIEQWRSQSGSFAEMAFLDGVTATLRSSDVEERISAVRTTPNLFRLLGVQPLHGRVFTPEEAGQRQRVALISHRFWQARFGGSLDALGADINLNGAASQVVGILPAEFKFDDDADVWEPHTLYPNWEDLRTLRGSGFWTVIGRLRPDVTLEQAQAEMGAIARRLNEQSAAGNGNWGVRITPLSDQGVGTKARLALWMLTGAVFFVLLIAATNVASLLLARSASREREIAIRAALGASRSRIVRQLLVESLTLAVIAGLLGLLLAVAGIRLILVLKPVNLARLNDVSLDPYVLGCALAMCLLTGILVGLMPAITMARWDLRPSSQEGGRSVAGGAAALRTRRALVVTEFALAVVLLVGAGLLVRSLWSVQRVDLGFRTERVLTVHIAAPTLMATGQRAGFYNRVLELVQSIPGVVSAGITSELFVSSSSGPVVTAERDDRRISERVQLRSDELSEGVFRVLGVPLLKGRFFSFQDGPDSPKVVIVNEAMARILWPGRDPVGQRFRFGSGDSGNVWFTVVGVVGDMRRLGLEKEPIPQMFQPLAQNPPGGPILLVRTSTEDPLKLAGAVRAAVRRVEKYAPVSGVKTLDGEIGALLAERRFQTSLLIGFAVVALLMAAVGIYGLIQYSVSTRTHEIGIRMAIGARTGDVFRMIIREGLKLSLTGLLLGLVGALWLGRAVSSLLFGVSATDPFTFATVSLLLAAVAAAACYFPARRAMRIEPVTALRQE